MKGTEKQIAWAEDLKAKAIAALEWMRENPSDCLLYTSIVTMLRSLREQGLVSGSEAKKIAARLRVQLGADIIISL